MNAPSALPSDFTPDDRRLLDQFPSRQAKIARIREIEKALARLELEDEENDPELIRAHIGLTRGYRMGCGVFLLGVAAMGARVRLEGAGWGRLLMLTAGLAGLVMILRGWLYRPDPKVIEAGYTPHRGRPAYRALIHEMDVLARALAQDLQSQDL